MQSNVLEISALRKGSWYSVFRDRLCPIVRIDVLSNTSIRTCEGLVSCFSTDCRGSSEMEFGNLCRYKTVESRNNDRHISDCPACATQCSCYDWAPDCLPTTPQPVHIQRGHLPRAYTHLCISKIDIRVNRHINSDDEDRDSIWKVGYQLHICTGIIW